MSKKNQVCRLKERIAALESDLDELEKENNSLLFRNEKLEIVVAHCITFLTAWTNGLKSDNKFWKYTTKNQFRDLITSLKKNGFDISDISHPLPETGIESDKKVSSLIDNLIG